MRATSLSVLAAAAAAAAIVAVSPAAAAVTVSSTAYGLDAYAAGSKVLTFDTKTPVAGFTITGGMVHTGDTANSVTPATSATTFDSTNYLAANAGNDAFITSVDGFKTVSLLWGSIDAYNTISLLDKSGSVIKSFTGDQINAPANGDKSSADTNRRVTFSTTGTTSAIYGLKLSSTQPAFEVDNVAFSAAVPEPASWAMMIGGFGAVGGSMRRRRRTGAGKLVLA